MLIMNLKISNKVLQKLTQRHGVCEEEIIQCFTSREKSFLEDSREDHKTTLPTQWFIAETDHGRKLKVVFMLDANGAIHIKTAYDANDIEKRIYNRRAVIL